MLNSELGHSNMEFNQRKEKYIERVKSNPELVLFIINTSRKENSELLLNPNNFNELKIAEIAFPFWEEIYSLVTNNEVMPDIENNIVVKMLIDSINKLKEKKDISITRFNYEEMDKLARFNYDTLVLTHANQTELFDYIGDKCGFDVENISDIERLNEYMALASLSFTKLKDNDLFNEDLTSLSDEDFQILIRYVNTFHKIYQENMENKQSKQKK